MLWPSSEQQHMCCAKRYRLYKPGYCKNTHRGRMARDDSKVCPTWHAFSAKVKVGVLQQRSFAVRTEAHLFFVFGTGALHCGQTWNAPALSNDTFCLRFMFICMSPPSASCGGDAVTGQSTACPQNIVTPHPKAIP